MRKDLCIHDAFNRQAALTPHATAVIDRKRSASYAEVQRYSLALANTLRSQGIGAEVSVALAAHRSLEAVVGIVGILQSGGAYLSIAPDDPDERIACILDNAAAAAVVAAPGLRERFASFGLDVIDLDLSDCCTAHTIDAVEGTNPEQLAAIVYTSGTTGTPKGVEISHRAIMARAVSGYQRRRGDLQKAALGVVAHFSDLLLPLLSGGPVIIVGEDEVRSGASLMPYVVQHGTTRLVFVPSQLAAALEAGAEAVRVLQLIDTLIVSGEALSSGLVSRLKRLAPHVVLANAYGASEVAGLVCLGVIDSPDTIHVGKAICGCEVHVLDSDLREVPPGTTGEIYLGGAQLARGYRRDPVLTAACFIPHPFKEGERLYRTGDLGQWGDDHRLRVLGRNDFEVKVHGFRVNLAEIEALLEGCRDVQRAVVVLDGEDATQRLSAYVVTNRGAAGQADGLRALLERTLPSYMVPSPIHVVQALPLLPNGKVDRAALQLGATRALVPAAVVPRRGMEESIANLWAEVLRVPHVAANDDFFSLGGDSLQAMRFVTRARAANLTVTLSQLAKTPTLSELARAIDEED